MAAQVSIAVLVAVDTLFLWMFFAADSFGAFAGASRVSAEWRHGMAGGWPFYMPGFFALTLAITWWWCGRTWRRLLVERILALVIASVVAVWLTPFAMPSLERLLVERGGPVVFETTLAVSWGTVLRAWFTVGVWSVFVGLCVIALQHRRPVAILGAVPGFVALHLTRSGEAGDLVQAWMARARAGEPEAWLTLALIPIAVWAVVVISLKGRGGGRNESEV